ncbi:MAG TPA: glycosyltransferase family 2 protein [Bacteroidales bacterium]|nr:glycosyltransferase family 2 protein [Bacteroidales bacterium]
MNHNTKISVIVITYNQQDVIHRALNSILIQKDWVYELIVCDDCSIDNNWQIIMEYADKYPGLIKPYRNEKNLGIFGNIEKSWEKVTGNLIVTNSGDDELCDGLLEKMYSLIMSNNLDCDKDAFCLYCDFKTIYPDGKECLFSNNIIDKGYNPLSLKLRQLIVNRTVLYSKPVLNQFKPVRKDIGIYADGLIDIQVQMFTDKSYYLPFTGSIYYGGIGISSKTKHRNAIFSYMLCYKEYKKTLHLSVYDKWFCDFQIYKSYFSLHPTWKLFFLTWITFFKCRPLQFGLVDVNSYFKQFIKMLIKLLNI